MENLTFDQLPQAITRIQEKLDVIEDLFNKEKIQPNKAEEILNISQAAAFLNLSVPTIYGRVCRHQMPVYKQGKRLYFYESELENWINGEKTFEELKEEAEERISGRRKFKMRRG